MHHLFPNGLHLLFLPSSLLDVCPVCSSNITKTNCKQRNTAFKALGGILLQLEFFCRAPAPSSWASVLWLVKIVTILSGRILL